MSPALMSTSRTLISTLQKLWKPPAVQRDERDGSTPVRSREPGGETDGDQAKGSFWGMALQDALSRLHTMLTYKVCLCTTGPGPMGNFVLHFNP